MIPTKKMKEKYIELIINHSFKQGYRQKLDNKIVNQYGYEFWYKLIYEIEAY